MEKTVGMMPGMEQDEWSNDACRDMSLWLWRTAAFQRRTYGALWGSSMKSLTSTACRMPKKSFIPVPTDLGPHGPEVEEAQRAAPAGAAL